MASFQPGRFAIVPERQGPGFARRSTFPFGGGCYSEIKTADFAFTFNPSGEIKFIRGLSANWPHPSEVLKRTDGNDWVYYSVGDDSTDKGIISWAGDYYLPCLPYQSNPVWEVDYLSDPRVMSGFAAWWQLFADLHGPQSFLPVAAKEVLERILQHDDNRLHARAEQLRNIIGGRISVLPPDTRMVDYETIPLIVADGCPYHCKFCCVRSARSFRPREIGNIREQIRQLKLFYGPNLQNYRALFLGNHDALAVGVDIICAAASEAYASFGFGEGRSERPLLFMFGSVDALLGIGDEAFEKIDQLPFHTCINVGFESVDKDTLAFIGKPLTASKVSDAFRKMVALNAAYGNLEVSGNFLLGEQLAPGHCQSLSRLLQETAVQPGGKGAVYLSPLKDNPKRRELLPGFYEIQEKSRLPVYIYLIQRL